MYLMDKTKTIGLIGMSAAAVNLLLNYMLIKYYGMTGAAWATVLSFAFLMGASYVCSQRALRMPLGLGRVGVGIVAAAGIYVLFRWRFPEPGGAAIVAKAGMLAAFPVLVWKTGLLTPSAAETLSSAGAVARKVLWRAYSGVAGRV
jgi:O-antigen/teichoic acid export membrane protein